MPSTGRVLMLLTESYSLTDGSKRTQPGNPYPQQLAVPRGSRSCVFAAPFSAMPYQTKEIGGNSMQRMGKFFLLPFPSIFH